MKKLLFAILSLGMFLISEASQDQKDELAFRRALNQDIRDLMYHSKYQELENMGIEFFETESRTSSGTWKLAQFIYAISPSSYDKEKTNLNSGIWAYRDRHFRHWIEQVPDTKFAYLYRAADYMSRAWSHRGSGPASIVTNDGWEGWIKWNTKAYEVLTVHGERLSTNPAYYPLLIEASKYMKVRSEMYNQIVNEGLDKFPSYQPIYFIASRFLFPQWGGSYEELDEFAKNAVYRNNYDPSMYSRIYWSSLHTGGRDLFSLNKFIDKKLLVSSIKKVLSEYPVDWNIQNYAKQLCYIEEYELVNQLITEIEDPDYNAVWNEQWFWACRTMGREAVEKNGPSSLNLL